MEIQKDFFWTMLLFFSKTHKCITGDVFYVKFQEIIITTLFPY